MNEVFSLIIVSLLINYCFCQVSLDIPARKMWGWGNNPKTGKVLHGFCGETSFQMSGIYYGQYVTSEKIRQVSVGGDLMNDLLVGVHDIKAAIHLGLKYEQFNQETPEPQYIPFLSWAKLKLDKGNPIIAGWMQKSNEVKQGYDHIMPIIGYDANDGKISSLRYYDLFDVSKSYLSSLLGIDREACKLKTSGDFPFDWCIPKAVVDAGAVLGPLDDNNELLRTKLIMVGTQEPDYSKEDGLDEKPEHLNAKIHITGLTPGHKYSILRFDDTPPSSNFLSASHSWRHDFTATESTFTMDLAPFMSNVSHFYRTVKNGQAKKRTNFLKPTK